MNEKESKKMGAHVLRVREIMQDFATELEALDSCYFGGEDGNPDEGYLFNADSISSLREQLSALRRQASGLEPQIPHQKDLSECICISYPASNGMGSENENACQG